MVSFVEPQQLNFSVKFSPSMCVAIVTSLTGEMAVRSFGYHTHGTADSDKSCCYAWFVCHDKTLNQQCLACSGSPPDDKSSYYSLLHVQKEVTYPNSVI